MITVTPEYVKELQESKERNEHYKECYNLAQEYFYVLDKVNSALSHGHLQTFVQKESTRYGYRGNDPFDTWVLDAVKVDLYDAGFVGRFDMSTKTGKTDKVIHSPEREYTEHTYKLTIKIKDEL